MRQRNIQQLRAAYALTNVQAIVAEQSESIQKRFKAYSNSLPAMVQMNGIGQALAFAYQKANGDKDENKGWKLLFNLVNHWLLKERAIWGDIKSGHVLNAITNGNQEKYQLAQAELQALLSWVKDFARAEIKGEAEQGE